MSACVHELYIDKDSPRQFVVFKMNEIDSCLRKNGFQVNALPYREWERAIHQAIALEPEPS